MKIALVANTSWNLYNFRLNLIRGFLAKGYEVICIAPYDSFAEELKKISVTFIPIEVNAKGNNPFLDIKLALQLYRIYKRQKPDVILQYTIKPNIYGTFAAALCGRSVINTVTGLGTVFLHDNLVSKIAQKLYTISFRFAKKVVFQNEDDRQLFIQKKLVDKEKTQIIRGSGVNVDFFIQNSGINKECKDKPFRFLMVARLLYDKGICEYAEASKKIHLIHGAEIECKLIGAVDSDKQLGIQKKDVADWALAHNLIYQPFSTDILSDYQRATVVVLPSYREGLPKSLLEAASCAKPLIASDVAGCKDVVIHEWNGLLCKAKDANDLFQKMNTMFHYSISELNTLASNSRERAEKNFSDKIIFNEYFCLSEQVYNNKKD